MSARSWAEHERCAVEDLGARACVVVEVGTEVAAVLVVPTDLGPTPYALHQRLNRALAARGLAPVEQTHLADPPSSGPLRRDEVRRRLERADLPTSGFRVLRACARRPAGNWTA